MKTLNTFIPVLVLCAVLGGCASGGKTAKIGDEPDKVWPAHPNQPSLEFLGVFASENNFAAPEEAPLTKKPIDQAEKLQNPVSTWTLADDKIVVVERSPADIKVIDFAKRKVYPLFNTAELAFSAPVDIAFDEKKNLYVVDREKKLVFVFDKSFNQIRQIGAELELSSLEKIAFNEAAGILYLSDSSLNEILAFDFEGKLLFRFGAGMLTAPHGIAIHKDGNIYVADTGNAKIRIFNSKGEFLDDFPIGQQRFISPLKKPWDVAFDHQGNLHIVDQGMDLFLTCRDDGEILYVTGSSKWQDNHLFGFNGPTDIHIDKSDRIFVTDANNFRLIVWQLFADSVESDFFSYFRPKMLFSYDEYSPKDSSRKGQTKARRPSVFRVGDAQNVTLEKVLQDSFRESRDTFKEVLCLGTVRCKTCRSYNNIYVDDEQIEHLLNHVWGSDDQVGNSDVSALEETSVACRECGQTLTISRLIRDSKVRFCLEPREICEPKK